MLILLFLLSSVKTYEHLPPHYGILQSYHIWAYVNKSNVQSNFNLRFNTTIHPVRKTTERTLYKKTGTFLRWETD